MGSYAGIDWAADKHDVRVCDEVGEELLWGSAGINRSGERNERVQHRRVSDPRWPRAVRGCP